MLKKLFFLLFLFVLNFMFPQTDSLQVKYDDADIERIEITDQELKRYLEDEKFNYGVAQSDNAWWQGIKNWFYNIFRQFFEWLFGVDNAGGYLAVFLQIVPYILLGLVLFLIIKFFINANSQAIILSRNNPNLVALSEEEQIFKSEDIQQLIKNAIANKDYRLAIRYYYLHLLRLLSDKELIDWQLQKTNDDYLNELKNTEFKSPFAKATLLYDYVWYGGFHIGEKDYNIASQVFGKFKNSLTSND